MNESWRLAVPGHGYDLHTHSHHSDGTASPAEIAELAHELHLSGFALTDHDTTVGWDEARAAAAHFSLDFLPGLELTTTLAGRSTHLLAYGVDPQHADLLTELAKIRDSREHRARRMVDRLAADFSITWDDVVATGEARSLGRPHIADALVERGYVSDRGEAFDRYLSPASRYYVPTYAPPTLAAVELVRAAGGAPVLAHPAAARHRVTVSDAELEQLTAAGLVGIELDHPENEAARVPRLRDAAARLGLIVTGASDFHGDGKPNRLGECVTSKRVVDQLRSHMKVKR